MEVISSKPVVFKEFSITLTVTTPEESQMLYNIFNHARILESIEGVVGVDEVAEDIRRTLEEHAREADYSCNETFEEFSSNLKGKRRKV